MTDANKIISESPNPADERWAQITALVLGSFSEGGLDVAAPKRALGEEAIIEDGERYELTWVEKGAHPYNAINRAMFGS